MRERGRTDTFLSEVVEASSAVLSYEGIILWNMGQ